MIHFKKISQDEIIFYFTEGISIHDLNLLQEKINNKNSYIETTPFNISDELNKNHYIYNVEGIKIGLDQLDNIDD